MDDFKITKAGFYKRRNGEKFEVVGKDANGMWIGKHPEMEEYTSYGENGVYRSHVAPHKTCYDAVAEWVAPKRIKGWVNIYTPDIAGDFRTGWIFKTKSEADKASSEDRIACVEIDVIEGHGLNGEAA